MRQTLLVESVEEQKNNELEECHTLGWNNRNSMKSVDRSKADIGKEL